MFWLPEKSIYVSFEGEGKLGLEVHLSWSWNLRIVLLPYHDSRKRRLFLPFFAFGWLNNFNQVIMSRVCVNTWRSETTVCHTNKELKSSSACLDVFRRKLTDSWQMHLTSNKRQSELIDGDDLCRRLVKFSSRDKSLSWKALQMVCWAHKVCTVTIHCTGNSTVTHQAINMHDRFGCAVSRWLVEIMLGPVGNIYSVQWVAGVSRYVQVQLENFTLSSLKREVSTSSLHNIVSSSFRLL